MEVRAYCGKFILPTVFAKDIWTFGASKTDERINVNRRMNV